MKRWILITAVPVVAVAAFTLTSHARQGMPPPPPPSPTTAPANEGGRGEGRGDRDDRRPMRDENDRGPRDGRGPRDDDRGPPMGGRDFGGPGGPEGRGGPDSRGGPDARGGPEGREGPGGPGRRPPTMDVMRNYVELVSRYTEVARDPTLSSISAIVTAGDLLRAKGNDQAIAFFEKLIPEIQSDAVNRAARFQLIELYKVAGQNDKALEQLRIIAASPMVTDLRVDSPTTRP